MRYKALLDGLEISEVMLSAIDLGDRMDAEHFSKSSMNIEHQLAHVKTVKIGDIASAVASAFYPAATQLYAVGDLPFVRCVDCVNYPVISHDQDETFEKIPYSFAIESKGISMLKRDEIVITKVGTPCYASIVDEYDEVALSRTVMGLKDIQGIDARYLMVFLRCKYGFGQLYRHREQTIQYQLTLPRVKAVDVFVPSEGFQKIVSGMVKDYRAMMREANSLYTQAQTLLASHTGQVPANPANITIRSFSQTFPTGRLDAEYFMPVYDDLFSLLHKLNTKTLGEIVSITKSIEPGSSYYRPDGLPFIRVSDITPMGITPPALHIPHDTVKNIEALYPRKDTILLSKDGSVGIAYKVEHDMKAVTSGALLHLRVKCDDVLPDYLALVLNSELVQLQAERDTNGAIIQHWRLEDIAKVIVPVIDMDTQAEISRLVKDSFSLRRKAEHLINLGVSSVQTAIESSEQNAVSFIKENFS